MVFFCVIQHLCPIWKKNGLFVVDAAPLNYYSFFLAERKTRPLNWRRWLFRVVVCDHWLHTVTDSAWWRHQMETFSALLAICAGNSPVNGEFPQKGQWRGALMFSLICTWINGWVNNREAGDLRRYRAHYDVTVMVVARNNTCECEVPQEEGLLGCYISRNLVCRFEKWHMTGENVFLVVHI